MIRAILATAVLMLSGGALAQPTAPALEVASVRKHIGRSAGAARFTVSGNNVTVIALDMYDLILEAYSLKDYQLYGSEGWMGGGKNLPDIVTTERGAEFYDLYAKAEGDAVLSRDQARLILQAVLADRFGLRVHRETRDLPVYALMVGKNGPKLKESAPDTKFSAGLEMKPAARMTNRRTTMTQFAGFLSVYADRPIVDRTGLTGFYDFTLEWSFDDSQRSVLDTAGVPGEADANGPSLFTAVSEQLGLKLDTSKAPIDVMVIDHAERPSEN